MVVGFASFPETQVGRLALGGGGFPKASIYSQHGAGAGIERILILLYKSSDFPKEGRNPEVGVPSRKQLHVGAWEIAKRPGRAASQVHTPSSQSVSQSLRLLLPSLGSERMALLRRWGKVPP